MSTATISPSRQKRNDRLATKLTRKLFRNRWPLKINFDPRTFTSGDEESSGHLWRCRIPCQIERDDYEDDFLDFYIDDRNGNLEDQLAEFLKDRISVLRELLGRLKS